MKNALMLFSVLLTIGFAHAAHAEKNCDMTDLKKEWVTSARKFSQGKASWSEVYTARFNYLFNANGCPELSHEAFCLETPALSDILVNQDNLDFEAGRISRNQRDAMAVLSYSVHTDCK